MVRTRSMAVRRAAVVGLVLALVGSGFSGLFPGVPPASAGPQYSHGGQHLAPFAHRSVPFDPPAPRTSPTVVPEYEQSGVGYTPDDLKFDEDVRWDYTLADLAASLGWDPWAIYNHVRNEYLCNPYWGSMKGAAGAYWDGEGNDLDLASLLIALLRSSNIPARYVHGTIRVTNEQAMDFTGLWGAEAAYRAFHDDGVPSSTDADFDPIDLEHVWAEAYLDGVWRPMDPCWKGVGWDKGQSGMLIEWFFEEQGFDTFLDWAFNATYDETDMMDRSAWGDDAVSFPHFDGTWETWFNVTHVLEVLTTYLNLTDPEKDPRNATTRAIEAATEGGIAPEEGADVLGGFLADAMAPTVDRLGENLLARFRIARETLSTASVFPHFPYTVLAVLATFAAVPDAMHHKFGVRYGGYDVLEPTAAFAARRLTMSSVAATAADAERMDTESIAWHRKGTVRVVPVLYRDGAAVALGSPQDFGENGTATFSFLSPYAADDLVDYWVPFGSELSLALDVGHMSSAFLGSRHQRYERTLQFLQLGLSAHQDEFAGEYQFLLAVYYWMKADTRLWQEAAAREILFQRFPSLAVAGFLILQDEVHDNLRVSPNFLDVIRDAINAFAADGEEAAQRFLYLQGWKDACTVSEALRLYGGIDDVVTACELFDLAISTWTDIVVVTPGRPDLISLLPPEVRDVVTRTTDAGGTAFVPANPLTTPDGRTITGAFTAGPDGSTGSVVTGTGASGSGRTPTFSGLGSDNPANPTTSGGSGSAQVDCNDYDPCKGVDLGVLKDIMDVVKGLAEGYHKYRPVATGVSQQGANSLRMSHQGPGSEVYIHGKPTGRVYGGVTAAGQHVVIDPKVLNTVKAVGKVAKVLNIVVNALDVLEALNNAVDAFCKALCKGRAWADTAASLAYSVLRKLVSSLFEAGGTWAGAALFGALCAALGSIVPGLGTAIGGVGCTIIGAAAGAKAASSATEWLLDKYVKDWYRQAFSDYVKDYVPADSEFCKEREKYKDCDKKPGGDNPDDKFDVSTGFIRGNNVFKTVMRNAARKGLANLLELNEYNDLVVRSFRYEALEDFRDEFRDLSAEASAQYALVQDRFPLILDEYVRAPDVAVLDRGFSNPMTALLQSINVPSVAVPSAFPAGMASSYRVLVLPSGSLAGLGDDPVFQARLSEYVASGGNVWAMAQQWGSAYGALPGGVAGFGWNEDQSCYWGGTYIAEYAPPLAGMDAATMNINFDGFFVDWPDNATVLSRRTANGMPAVLAYDWGAGRIVATSQFTDYASAHSAVDEDGMFLLRDGMAWLLYDAVEDLPAEEALQVPLLVENLGTRAGAKIVVAEVRPNMEIRAFHNITRALAPGANVTVTVDMAPVPSSDSGVWYLDYAVLDAAEELVYRRWDVAVLAISPYRHEPGGFSYAGSALSFAVVIPQEYYVLEATIPFSLLFFNTGSAVRRLRARTWFRVNSVDQTFNVTVPAGTPSNPGQASVVYTRTMSGSGQNTLNMEVQDADDNFAVLGRVFKTFRFVQPSVQASAAISGTQFVAGETVAVAYALLNQIAYDYTVAVTASARDPSGTTLVSASRNESLAAEGTAEGNFTLELPGVMDPGPHLVVLEVLVGSTFVTSFTNTFQVPAADLVLTPSIPATLEFQNPFLFRCTLENVGDEDIDAGTFRVTLYDPDLNVLGEGSQPFALPAGGSIPIAPVALNPGPGMLGGYKVHYVASGETGSVAGALYLDNRVPASVEFSQDAYRIVDDLAFDVLLENAGPFNVTVNVTVEAPDVGLNATTPVSLAAGESTNLSYAGLPIPDGLAPGFYPVSVERRLRASSLLDQLWWQVLPSRLEVGTNASVYDAGDSLGITLTNVGGVNSTWDYDVELIDARGASVFQASGNAAIGVLETLVLNYSVPTEAVSGDYLLVVRHQDASEGFYRRETMAVRIRGVVVDLTIAAGSEGYFSGTNVTALSTLHNLNEPASNLTHDVLLQAFAAMVSGTVREWGTNATVSAAQVTLTTVAGREVTAYSNPLGEFDLVGAPASVLPQLFTTRKNGYAPSTQWAVVPASGTLYLEVWLNRTVTRGVSGYVKATASLSLNLANGTRGAIGAKVTLSPLDAYASYAEDLMAYVAGDGTFAFPEVPEGTYRLTIEYGGTWNDTVVVNATLGLLEYLLPGLPESLGRVAGTVNDSASGLPVEGALASLGNLSARTDGAGWYYFLDVPPGRYDLAVAEYRHAATNATVDVVGGPQWFNLSMDDAYPFPWSGAVRVQGNVTDGTAGLPGVLVRLVPAAVASAFVPEERHAWTDASGAFDIRHLPPGTYNVTFNKTGFGNMTAVGAFLADTAGYDQVLTWSWTRTATVQGTVVELGTGAPIAGATVQIGGQTTNTDGAGGYAISGVPINSLGDVERPYSVGATAAGYVFGGTVLNVTDGLNVAPQIQLTPVVSGGDSEPNDDFANATATTVNSTWSPLLPGTGDNEYYVFTVPFPGQLTATASAVPDVSAEIYLYDAGQSQLDYVWSSSGLPVTSTNWIDTPGTYYARLRAWSGGNGTSPATLTIALDDVILDPDGSSQSFATAQVVNLEETVASLRASTAESDYYRFTVPQRGLLSVDLFSVPGTVAPEYYLYDDAQNQLDYTWSSAGQPLTGTYYGAAGDYFLRVRGWSGTSHLPTLLRVSLWPNEDLRANLNFTTAEALLLGQTAHAGHGANYDDRYWSFALPTQGMAFVTLHNPGDGAAYELYLYDDAQNQLAYTWESANLDIAYSRWLGPGTYYLRTRPWSGGESHQEYGITVEADLFYDPHLAAQDRGNATVLPLDREDFVYFLDSSTPRFWSVDLAQAGYLRVEITSVPATIAVEMYLRDANGVQLTYTWRSGGTSLLHSELLAAGTYYLELRAWSYSLTLTPVRLLALFEPLCDPYPANVDSGTAAPIDIPREHRFLFSQDDEWFSIDLEDRAVVTFNATRTPPGIGWTLYLYDEAVNYLTSQWFPVDAATLWTYTLPAGRSYLRFTRWGGTDDSVRSPAVVGIDLFPRVDPYEPNDLIDDAAVVDFAGTLTAFADGWYVYDYYRFWIPFAGTLNATATVADPNLDLQMQLYDATGNWLESVDQNGSGGSERLLRAVTPGYYHLAVVPFGTSDIPYEVRLALEGSGRSDLDFPGLWVWATIAAAAGVVDLVDWLNLTTDLGPVCVDGAMRLVALLYNALGQPVADAEDLLTCSTGDYGLRVLGTREVYPYGATASVRLEADVRPGVDPASLGPLPLTVVRNGRLVFSEVVDFAAGSYVRDLAFTVNNSFEMVVTLGNLTVVSHHLARHPLVQVSVDWPTQVGRDPFDILVEITNAGDMDVKLGVEAMGVVQPVRVPIGESRTVVAKAWLYANGTVFVNVSGDYVLSVSRFLPMLERVLVEVDPFTSYHLGGVAVPYRVTNVGWMDSDFDLVFVMDGNRTVIPIVVRVGENVSGEVAYNLSVGEHTFTYECPFCTSHTTITVTEDPFALSVDTSASVPGTLLLRVSAERLVNSDFSGALRVETDFFFAEIAFNATFRENVTIDVPVSLATAPLGPHTFAIEVREGGAVVTAIAYEYEVVRADFTATPLDLRATYDLGENVTVQFTVENVGNIPGTGGLRFVLPGIVDAVTPVSLDPAASVTVAVNFLVPEDLDVRNLTATWSVGTFSDSAPVTVNGARLVVAASLDKPAYRRGESAVLTMTVDSQNNAAYALFAKIQMGSWQEKRDFSLGALGDETLTFTVSLDFSGDKILYSVYFASGRSIYINSLFVYEDTTSLTGASAETDRSVYFQGETVAFTLTPDAGRSALGIVELEGVFREERNVSAAETFLVDLPAALRSGTYQIAYWFGGSPGLVAFDVVGYDAKVERANLDKDEYGLGDAAVLSVSVLANEFADGLVAPPVDATLSALLLDASGAAVDAGSTSLTFAGGTWTESVDLTVAGTAPGTYTVLYDVTILPGNNVTLLLASGSLNLHVVGASLVTLSSGKAVYGEGENVTVTGSAFDAAGSALTLFVNGAARRTTTVAAGGLQTLDFDLADLPPGDHEILALLEGPNGTTRRSTTVTVIGTRSGAINAIVDIHDFRFEPPTLRAGQAATVIVPLENLGTQPLSAVQVTLIVDGVALTTKTVDLPGSTVVEVAFPWTPAEGAHDLRVRLAFQSATATSDTFRVSIAAAAGLNPLAVLGIVVGVLLALYLFVRWRARKRPEEEAKPEEAKPAEEAKAPEGPDPRLAKIQQLLDRGLITQEEYEAKRREIVGPEEAKAEGPALTPEGQERLAALEEALRDGLFTQEEFDAKKAALLQDFAVKEEKPPAEPELPAEVKERLAALDEAVAEGFLTKEEAEAKKAAILKEAGAAAPKAEPAPEAKPAEPELSPEVKERLATLEEARDAELITAEEFEEKKAAIFAEAAAPPKKGRGRKGKAKEEPKAVEAAKPPAEEPKPAVEEKQIGECALCGKPLAKAETTCKSCGRPMHEDCRASVSFCPACGTKF